MNRRNQLLAFLTMSLMGCGAAIDTAGFDLAPCDHGVSDLSPAEAVDYIGLIEFGGYFGPGGIDETGEACAGASDEEACLAAVEDLPRDRLMENPGSSRALVTTAGDDVSVYFGADEVVGFFGEIDTPGEAIQVALFSDYEVRCAEVESGGVKQVSNGFELLAVEVLDLCGPERTQQVHLHISSDGAVEVLGTGDIRTTSSACP